MQSPLLQWIRRPQFSMRAFLIFVTFICAPLAFIGAIKYRAHTHHTAIAELAGRGIEVRQLRTENGGTMWQRFVQDWIETDAYAGAVVELTLSQQDLTDHDVQLLGIFDQVRSVDLASNKLTDETLSRLPQVGPIRSLTVRAGAYTSAGVKTISEFKNLKALDLSGMRLDFEKLSGLKPVFDVDELALVVDACTPEQLEQLFKGKSYRRLYLENAALGAYLQESPRTYGRDANLFPSMPLTAKSIPNCKELTLKGMQLSDDTLSELSKRKDLALLHLWECHFDATMALRLFQSPGINQPAKRAETPVISLRGHASAKGELTAEEFARFLNHPAIVVLSVEKLTEPDKAMPTILKLSKLNSIFLPAEIPTKDLVELFSSKQRPVSISIARTAADFEDAKARHPKVNPQLLRYIDIYSHLSQNGVDPRELQLKIQQITKPIGGP